MGVKENETSFVDYFTAKNGLNIMQETVLKRFDGKTIPKNSLKALETIKTTLNVIEYLYDTLEKEYNDNKKLESQVNALALTNGILKRDNNKLKRENERLLKNVRL
jgi:cell division protein FtsB